MCAYLFVMFYTEILLKYETAPAQISGDPDLAVKVFNLDVGGHGNAHELRAT